MATKKAKNLVKQKVMLMDSKRVMDWMRDL